MALLHRQLFQTGSMMKALRLLLRAYTRIEERDFTTKLREVRRSALHDFSLARVNVIAVLDWQTDTCPSALWLVRAARMMTDTTSSTSSS